MHAQRCRLSLGCSSRQTHSFVCVAVSKACASRLSWASVNNECATYVVVQYSKQEKSKTFVTPLKMSRLVSVLEKVATISRQRRKRPTHVYMSTCLGGVSHLSILYREK
jgi:hypothetical protein